MWFHTTLNYGLWANFSMKIDPFHKIGVAGKWGTSKDRQLVCFWGSPIVGNSHDLPALPEASLAVRAGHHHFSWPLAPKK